MDERVESFSEQNYSSTVADLTKPCWLLASDGWMSDLSCHWWCMVLSLNHGG